MTPYLGVYVNKHHFFYLRPELAQGRFLTGRVIPLVVGAFGDVNEALKRELKQVAKAAAAGTDGLTISPLINTDRKGGAFRIMRQQFRRAIGCATVRGQAKLTLGRLKRVVQIASQRQ
jgi:hypothetical protein